MKRTKTISSVTLMVCAFLALIAGINAANPKWSPLNATELTFPLLRGGSPPGDNGPPPPYSNSSILFARVFAHVAAGRPPPKDGLEIIQTQGQEGPAPGANPAAQVAPRS